tara:strand:- start:27 stop:227 length:201 start_codon:yes stop_codon:yes gene_type:complete
MKEGDDISIAEREMILGIEDIIEILEKMREVQVSTDKTVYWIMVILMLPYLFGILWLFLSLESSSV